MALKLQKSDGFTYSMPDLPSKSGADPSGVKPAAWYQVVLSAIGDAVLTTDPDGLVT